MKFVLAFAAIGEAATGLLLLLAPTVVGQLLLGSELTGVAETIARVAGIAIVALSVACWPGTPLLGMTIYSAAIALYFAYLGLSGGGGMLLWPAAVLHLVLTALLARALMRGTGSKA